MIVFCSQCEKEIYATFKKGYEIYNDKNYLRNFMFLSCDDCKNYIGCYIENNLNYPFATIPKNELRTALNKVHEIIESVIRNGKISCKEIHDILTSRLGYQYYTEKIQSIEQARDIYRVILNIKKEIA